MSIEKPSFILWSEGIKVSFNTKASFKTTTVPQPVKKYVQKRDVLFIETYGFDKKIVPLH